jgi:hypothetical protein
VGKAESLKAIFILPRKNIDKKTLGGRTGQKDSAEEARGESFNRTKGPKKIFCLNVIWDFSLY